jgi:hypothetical protein
VTSPDRHLTLNSVFFLWGSTANHNVDLGVPRTSNTVDHFRLTQARQGYITSRAFHHIQRFNAGSA